MPPYTYADLTVFFDPAAYNVTEGVNFKVSLMVSSTDYSFPFSVSLTYMDNTAVTGKDYLPIALSVDFNAGQKTAMFDATTIDDNTAELAEKFYIVILNTSSPSHIRLGTPSTASVNIVDSGGKSGYKAFYTYVKKFRYFPLCNALVVSNYITINE